MLIRPHDALEDRTAAIEFLTAQGFGHLAASGHDHDVPVVVPTQFVVDGDEIADVLRTQVGALEPGSGLADPAEHAGKFRVIRGLRLSMDEVRGKFKYGGNVDIDHREAVAERLRTRNGPGDLAAAAHVPGVSA